MEIDSRAKTPLRYRFSSLDQARAHLRNLEGRWLFFYREDKLRLLPSAPVCLQLRFDDGGEGRLLQARVQGSLEGSGTWLEILDARPLLSAVESPRAHRRLGCDLPVELRADSRIEAGRLLDLSAGGARIIGIEQLSPGQPVELRLPSADRLTFRDLSFGQVAWAARSELGIRFDPADSVGRSAIARLLQEMEAHWQGAWESAHPRFCCQAAGLVEPEPPRLRRPDDITGKIAL